MINSIVHIKSSNENNQSFGTGFVIHNNQNGIYILTCDHVLESVQNAIVESHSVEIVVKNSFLDMAIIFVPSLHHKQVTLQLESCPNLHIKSVAFSQFKEDLVQKSTIHATLFKDFIELHSTEDDSFYLMKKLKADPDYSFSRGNSGAPIICNESGHVIAMLSNKSGTSIAYAIGVSCLKKLLEQIHADPILLEKHQTFYEKMSTFKQKVIPSIEEKKSSNNITIYNIDELEKKRSNFIKIVQEKIMKLKYFFLGILTVLALYGVYSFFKQEKVQNYTYYRVTNVPLDETLNVRKGAGRGYKVIYELPHNAKHIMVSQCKYNDEAKKWCMIEYKNIIGWVHSYYIEEESTLHP